MLNSPNPDQYPVPPVLQVYQYFDNLFYPHLYKPDLKWYKSDMPTEQEIEG